ncbi:DUF1918 domain-containing protein [Leifsonia sp. P73]|uniref:DUF1918 domain-containing protein n=1 Tax=Leifsonia sp. P73 TaxID=3423959 RepID=UPI003DA582C0
MQAKTGDFLVIASNHLEESPRVGIIEEVHGDDGAPPYVVKWEEDGRTTIVFPGSDAHIEQRGHDTAGAR